MAKTFNQLTIAELEERDRQLTDAIGTEEIRVATPTESPTDQLGPAGLSLREQELTGAIGDNDQFESLSFSPIETFEKDSDVLTLLRNPTNATFSFGDLINNSEDLKNNTTIWDSPQSGKIGFVETFADTKIKEKLPFVGSLYKAKKITNVMIAAQTINTGQVTELKPGLITVTPSRSGRGFRRDATDAEMKSSLKLIEAWIQELDEKQTRGISVGGRIAEGITELPAFIVEFLLTGPLFSSGSASAKIAATKVLGRFAEKGVGKLAVRVAGAGFGSLVRTAVNIPRVLAGAAKNMTEGIQITDDGSVVFADAENKPFNALARSFLDLYIENISEVSGKAIGEGFSFAGKGIAKKFPVIGKFTKELAEKWIANKQGRTIAGFLKASSTKIGYDGILQEFGEERLGAVLRAATGLDSFSEIVPSWEELLVEAGVLVPFGGVSLAANKIFRKDAPIEPVEKQLGLVDNEFDTGVPEPLGAPEAVTKPKQERVEQNTIKTKSEGIQVNVRENAIEPTGTLDAIKRTVQRANTVLRGWGTAGQKVARDLDEISARTAKNTGNTTQDVKAILKGLSSQEKTIVAQLTDGAISKEGHPVRLIARADKLKEQLDIMQDEAISVGLRTGALTGKAFPQVPNKKGKAFIQEAETKGAQSSRIFAWAQNKVNEGKFKDVDSAIAALQNYRKDRLRGTEGYFEGQRTVELDLDMREWSPDKLLPGIIEGGWESIEGARQWGVTKDGNFKTIRTSIEQIRQDTGPDQARMLEDYIKAQYGQSRASVTAKRWSKRARAVQFIGKLAFSPLTITRNMLDRYAKGLTHGTIGTNIRATIKFPPFLNKFLKKSQQIQDEMIRQGAVLGHGHLSEGFTSESSIQRIVGQPFALSEKGNQTYIALIKQMQLEADIRTLNEMGGENGTIGKMYNRLLSIVGSSQQQTRSRVLTDLTNEQLVDAMAKGKISDEVMSEVLHRTVTNSAFPLTLASKRLWWGNQPWLQTATQFKVWSADQMGFIYKDVLKYTIATGDPSRLARFMIGTWLAGEMYNIARDFLTGKDESLLFTLQDEDGRNVKAIAKSIANALVDGGIVGMLADLTYGITDWAFGPTVASIESAARIAIAVKNDPATTIDGLKKFLLDDVPAAKQAQGLIDRIDRTFFTENNLTENYSKWRKRSFEFQRGKGELTAIERATGRVILGRPSRLPGPRTLSLEMITRQVLVGDVEDAADYIVAIFEDTKPEKIKDLRSAFRQSAINNSPMGNIKKDNVPEFLNQFSKENQEQIKSLQIQWAKNYDAAFKIAAKRLKETDFVERLRKEFNEDLKKE